MRHAAIVRPTASGRFGYSSAVAPLLVLAVALLARVVVLVQLQGHPALQVRGVLDDAVYWQLAKRVAAGDLALGPHAYFLSPFYTYFLGLVFAVSGGSIMIARLVQVLLGVAAVALIMEAARSWYGARVALISGLLAACTGLFAFNEILILQSSIDPFLTSLALFALARALKSRRLPSFVLAGLALSALALNRPNAAVCLVGLVALWLAVKRSRSALKECLAFSLGAMLLLVPVAVRNGVVAGEFVPMTSHGGLNFYIGNHETADGTWKRVAGVRDTIEGQIEDVRRVAGQALGRPVSESEASSYFYRVAWEWIRSDPHAWLRLTLRKVALVLNAADTYLNYSYAYFAKDESTLLSWLPVGPWLVVPLGIFGLFVGAPARKEWPAYAVWAAFVPIYALAVAAFFVSSRYRLPLLVGLLMASGAGVSWLVERVRTANVVGGARGVAVLTLLFVGANWPMGVDEGRSFEREEHIIHLIADGRVSEADLLVSEANRESPLPSSLLSRAGLVLRAGGHNTRALDYLQRALATNPADPVLHVHVGETLLEMGRPQEALRYLEIARASPDVDASVVASDLAGAYQSLGNSGAALQALASVAVSPTLDDQGLLRLGQNGLALGDGRVAERFLRELVRRQPDSARAHEELGLALGMQGRTEHALVELELAARLDPSNPTTHYHLALGYAQAGRFTKAREECLVAIQLNANHSQARMLLSRLPPSDR